MINNLSADVAQMARRVADAQAKAKIREIVREELRAAGVLKPKRYVLPMDGTEDDGWGIYTCLTSDGNWDTKVYEIDDMVHSIVMANGTVTQADIDAAPAWVKAIKPVEVTEHD